jgi:hypothetical protein
MYTLLRAIVYAYFFLYSVTAVDETQMNIKLFLLIVIYFYVTGTRVTATGKDSED